MKPDRVQPWPSDLYSSYTSASARRDPDASHKSAPDVAHVHYGFARKTSRHVGSQRPTTSAQPTGFGPVEP